MYTKGFRKGKSKDNNDPARLKEILLEKKVLEKRREAWTGEVIIRV